MPSNYGAFDEDGNPIRSSVNPAFTGAPPAPPVLRELPTPAPDRLFNPNAMPQLPSVQPQTPAPSLLRRAADFGTEVSALFQALPDECRCVVLARGAVVGAAPPLRDLTPDARRRLGL